MKWIGQHIVDLIARFRSKVYIEGDLTVNGTATTFESSTADSPLVKILNTTDDDQASQLIFEKLRDDDAVDTGQNLGEVWFTGQDSAQNTQKYGYILGEIDVSTGGQESGKLSLGVAAHDGDNGAGLMLTGGSVDAEIDVEIGKGAASVTTVAGTLTMGSTAAMDNTGLLTVATQTGITTCANLTTVGSIGAGTWRGSVIDSSYLDADTAHYSAQRQLTYYMFRGDIDTTKTYIGLQEADAEATSSANKNLPILAPFAGKLLKVFLRATSDVSGNTFTWRLETKAAGAATGGTPVIVGTQSGAGCSNLTMTTYDFTTGLDSGDNIIDAGDTVQLSIESDGATSTTTYDITCLWEWNLG